MLKEYDLIKLGKSRLDDDIIGTWLYVLSVCHS